jgi:hypothetical protein
LKSELGQEEENKLRRLEKNVKIPFFTFCTLRDWVIVELTIFVMKKTS